MIKYPKGACVMTFIKENWKGVLFCLAISVPSWILGNLLPVIGGAVFAIIIGMIIAIFFKEKNLCKAE